MSSKICFYHYPCADGVTSAWCVRKAIPDIKYWGIKPQDDQITDEKYKGKDVIFVDVTPSERKLVHMLEVCKSVIILDHHITNEKIINKYVGHPKLTAVFDMHRSGCQLAWDYFHLNVGSKTPLPRPWFVDYVGDRDLWQFELPNSKLINMALMELDYLDINELEKLYQLTKNEKERDTFINGKMLPTARVLEMKNEKILKIALSGACRRSMNVKGVEYDVWVANTFNYLSSELGNRLMYKKFADGSSPHFAVIWSYKFNDNLWQVSLRSLDIDVSPIAVSFGGGGHKQASGFNFKGDFQSLFTKHY